LEDSSQLFYQAATLMLVGMGFVYAFLSLMIFVIKILIAPLANRFPDELSNSNRPTKPTISTAGSPDTSIVAAISAAVTQHRNRSR